MKGIIELKMVFYYIKLMEFLFKKEGKIIKIYFFLIKKNNKKFI